MAEFSPPPTLPDPTELAVFRGDIWAKSFASSVVLLAPALVLGLTRDTGNFDAHSDGGWSTDCLLQVALPGFLVWGLTCGIVSRIPTVLGFGMLREIGYGTSVKESIRTNMTNNGIVLALFLTMLLSMWQMAKNKDGFTRNDMWYRMFLFFGIEACTRGLTMVSTFLVFMEPLGTHGAENFAVDNMLFLGEPTTCIGLVMLYFAQACLIWVFNTDAKYVGILCYLLMGYCITRCCVVARYLQDWKNPFLADSVRQERISKLKLCRAVDGTSASSADLGLTEP